jgi:hypothetical protein
MPKECIEQAAGGRLELVESNEGEMGERKTREVEGRNECGVERQELNDWGVRRGSGGCAVRCGPP